jgi:hypothetical protein
MEGPRQRQARLDFGYLVDPDVSGLAGPWPAEREQLAYFSPIYEKVARDCGAVKINSAMDDVPSEISPSRICGFGAFLAHQIVRINGLRRPGQATSPGQVKDALTKQDIRPAAAAQINDGATS